MPQQADGVEDDGDDRHLVDEHAGGHHHLAGEHPGEQRRDGDEGEHDVLADDPGRAGGEVDGVGDAGEAARHDGDVGGLDGDGGGRGAEGDAHVRGGEGRGVVDPVADHGDDVALLPEAVDGLELVLGGEVARHLVEADRGADGLTDHLGVAGEHDEAVDAHRPERVDPGGGVGAHLVGDADGADHPVVGDDEHGGAAAEAQLVERGVCGVGHVDAELGGEAGGADGDAAAVVGDLDPGAGVVDEAVVVGVVGEEAPVGGGVEDRRGEGVLGAGLGEGGEA